MDDLPRMADADLSGKAVLLRSDLNLTLADGTPQPDLRFERYMETVQDLVEMDARTVIMAHQGRPAQDDFTALDGHADLVAEHLGTDVTFVDGLLGTGARQALDGMEPGDVAMMDNVRLLSEELQSLDPAAHANDIFVRRTADAFDAYVNDAFSAAHRSHASLVGFTPVLPSYAGSLMVDELANCTEIRDEIDSPVLVLGGEKPADIVAMLDRMVDRAEKVLLGGIPGELALDRTGHDIGEKKRRWIRERSMDAGASHLVDLIERHPDTFVLPTDVRTDSGNHSVDNIPAGEQPWDIGKETQHTYRGIIEDADAVVMKGPMGAFEQGFDEGTKTVIDAIATCDGFTVLGGGHTSSLVSLFHHDVDEFSHVSIAGGAFVRFMGGESLPAVEALRRYA